ncbi:YrhB domain-containing protein [Streptomyces rimosus]|uniref:YrhB domain-containing protein n=1 Tax=Streptomyces rimosus TaxID=1927 RepID=UPI0037892C4F
MLSRAQALQVAEELLKRETRPNDPPMAIDADNVEERDGLLIVPFNGIEYLKTRDLRDMLLDCWPILVDLASGQARMGTINDRSLWAD